MAEERQEGEQQSGDPNTFLDRFHDTSSPCVIAGYSRLDPGYVKMINTIDELYEEERKFAMKLHEFPSLTIDDVCFEKRVSYTDEEIDDLETLIIEKTGCTFLTAHDALISTNNDVDAAILMVNRSSADDTKITEKQCVDQDPDWPNDDTMATLLHYATRYKPLSKEMLDKTNTNDQKQILLVSPQFESEPLVSIDDSWLEKRKFTREEFDNLAGLVIDQTSCRLSTAQNALISNDCDVVAAIIEVMTIH